MRLTAIRNKLKQIICARGGLGLLQMVSKLDTEQCASEDAAPPRGWIVRSHLGWREKQNIRYKGVEKLSHIVFIINSYPLQNPLFSVLTI